MPAIGELIDELRAEGDLDSQGEFSLDRAKAREKMRHFQLADPRSYVLELVQSAVLAGASEARFEIDADDMFLEFDGRAFTAEELERIHVAMFLCNDSTTARALSQLAIGVNAAMALDPRRVRVESGRVLMEMRSGADADVSLAALPRSGTRVHVKDRFSAHTLTRFLGQMRGRIAEADYLRQRCRHAALSIYLGGTPISGQPMLPDVLARVEVIRPPVRVVAGFRGLKDLPAKLYLFLHGVQIVTHALERFPRGFVACAESADLTKDMSQSDVVRDEAYERLLKVVNRGLLRALAHLARSDPKKATKPLLKQVLLHPLTVPLMRQLIGSAADHPDYVQEMASKPIWRSARGRGEDLSLLDLHRIRKRHGKVGWSPLEYRDLQRGDRPPVALVADRREREFLEAVLGDDFYDASDLLHRERIRANNELRWLSYRMEPRIPAPRDMVVSVPLPTQEATGEVGIYLDPSGSSEKDRNSSLWLIKEGRLLERRAGRPFLAGLAVAAEADFQPTVLFDAALIDLLYVRVVLAVAWALRPLMDAVANTLIGRPDVDQRYSSLRQGCLVSFLAIDWKRDLRRFLECFGVTSEAHLAYAGALLGSEGIAITLAEIESAEPPPLARISLFDRADGKMVSLREIAASRRSEGAVRYVPKHVRVDQSLGVRSLLVLDGEELRALGQVFSENELKDDSALAAVHGRVGLCHPNPDDTVTAKMREEDSSQTREAQLLLVLQSELRRVLGSRRIDKLGPERIGFEDSNGGVIVRCTGQGVTLDRGQPLVKALLEAAELDPVLVGFLASALYSALNHFWQDVEDDHERELQNELAAGLVSRIEE